MSLLSGTPDGVKLAAVWKSFGPALAVGVATVKFVDPTSGAARLNGRPGIDAVQVTTFDRAEYVANPNRELLDPARAALMFSATVLVVP
jgi:hypothetical protein